MRQSLQDEDRKEESENNLGMLIMAQSYMILEEKMNILFENPASVDANSSRPPEIDSLRRKDKFVRGMHIRYDKYTPLSVSQEKIYQDYPSIVLKRRNHTIISYSRFFSD